MSSDSLLLLLDSMPSSETVENLYVDNYAKTFVSEIIVDSPDANKIQVDLADDDEQFSLLLVPMFKTLNKEQKQYAQVEILNVMSRAKHYKQEERPLICLNCSADTDSNFFAHQSRFLPNCQTSPSPLELNDQSTGCHSTTTGTDYANVSCSNVKDVSEDSGGVMNTVETKGQFSE